ncbi:hypothetical protein [Undibacterium squillarum]|uniref:hypothetical protein n=1 Tax=Undibacterium squillarum TaxID=1131567 RepID=UPI0016723D84|nr:hypothetical protein [Undibacterium squillarum]
MRKVIVSAISNRPAGRFFLSVLTCSGYGDCAAIRIHHFRRAGLSADDRRIAVQNSAFGAFSGVLRALPALFNADAGRLYDCPMKNATVVRWRLRTARQIRQISKRTGISSIL